MGYLGCADGYVVQFTTKDHKLIGETDQSSSVDWGRKLDNYSQANVSFDLGSQVDSGSCCKLIDRLDVRRDHMSLLRIVGSTSEMVWTGPIQRIESRRGIVNIAAVDNLALYQNRVLHTNHDFTATDLADIWNAYLSDANDADPIITDLCPPTGILLDTQQNAYESDMAMGAMKVILEAGLDVTIHRGTIVYGGKAIRLQPMALRDDHFNGDVAVIQDASRIASQLYVKGYSDDQADYPNPGITPASGYYGIVERIYTEPNVEGVTSLTQVAVSHYDQMALQKPFYLDLGDGSLAPSAPVDINDLVCGTVFNVSIQDVCPPMEQPLRMFEMSATMSGGDEVVTIGLQPIGALEDES